MKIAAAQINPTIGDFDGNVDRILTFVSRAREMEAQLVVFPEMSLTGYPPRDLLERGWFVDRNLDALNQLAAKVKDIGVIVGFVDKNTSEGKPLYNAAALIENGEIAYVSYKSLLPTYDVFDEDRYFEPAAGTAPVKFGGTKLALTICEDLRCAGRASSTTAIRSRTSRRRRSASSSTSRRRRGGSARRSSGSSSARTRPSSTSSPSSWSTRSGATTSSSSTARASASTRRARSSRARSRSTKT
jgi:hypothetical protein